MSTVMSWSATDRLDDADHLLAFFEREPGEALVQHQERRPGGQRLADLELLRADARRARSGSSSSASVQVDDLGDALDVLLGESVHHDAELDVTADGQIGDVGGRLVGRVDAAPHAVPDPSPRRGRRPRSGLLPPSG